MKTRLRPYLQSLVIVLVLGVGFSCGPSANDLLNQQQALIVAEVPGDWTMTTDKGVQFVLHLKVSSPSTVDERHCQLELVRSALACDEVVVAPVVGTAESRTAALSGAVSGFATQYSAQAVNLNLNIGDERLEGIVSHGTWNAGSLQGGQAGGSIDGSRH